MSSDIKKIEYDRRFRLFLKQIVGVSRMKPREKYLYPIMESVPFKDLEVAILMKHIDYGIATNDNKNNGQ